jgi:hypothetical protein
MTQPKLAARLNDEIDAMLLVAFHMRTAFENELKDGMGHKMLAIPDKLVKKGQELAKMLDTLTSAKIRYDKAVKKLSDDMTPEEERKAVVTYIKALDPPDRAELISGIQRWRWERKEIQGRMGDNVSPSLSTE